jgi:pimeloyl-ACP methyl ester carboxylesterase
MDMNTGTRTKLTAFTLFLTVAVLGGTGTARGAGKYLKIDYPASTNPSELQTPVTYILWIPDGGKTLRGLIVHQHGAGTVTAIQGATAAYDLHWQALAKKWDCALLGPSYHVTNEKIDLSPGGSEAWFDPRHGSEKTFLRSLDEFAAQSGHPELKTVPWVLWGHSGGGIWSDVMACLHPERVAAIWLRSGTASMFRTMREFPQPEVPEAIYGIPIMCNCGVKEMKGVPWIGSVATFQEFRFHGAPIGFAPDPLTGHECGDSRYLAIPFLDACMAMRLPDPGSASQTLKPVDMSHTWLAPLMSQQAMPAADFKGNPKVAVWLPNQAIAKAWMDYVKTGAVSDTTPPPAPYDVKTATKENEGTEITWQADADFESGIRNFVIWRDGQELASVPEKPVGKFGRPLFQSMTFHDTPSQPMPEMRYLDATAKAGEKHTYEVVEVNGVELKSKPASAQPGGQ